MTIEFSSTLFLLHSYTKQQGDYSELVEYDANTNITSLQRYGMKNDKSFGLIDDLSIEHNGNQISSVTDAVDETLDYEGAFDFADGDDKDKEYAYNGNGALAMDLNKGIQNIEYDLLGNPKKITLANNVFIEYVYAPDGRRLRTKHYRLLPNPSYSSLLLRGERYLQIGDSIDYVGNLILKSRKPQMYQFAGGYYSFDGDKKPECHYYIQDYQGNNRMVVNADKDSIEQITHYYPYGGVIGNLSSNQEAQRYKYSGKELDRTYGLDLYDFHARQYDAAAPWFISIDALAEKYYGISPYAYCAGNPVNCVDKDGKDIYDINKWGKITKSASSLGTYIGFANKFVQMSASENNYDVILNSIIDNSYALTSVEQALDLQKIMTEYANQEWTTVITNDGQALLVTNGKDGGVNSLDARSESGIEEKDISIRIHNHPGRNAEDGSTSEGTRGGSEPDLVYAKDAIGKTRFFVSHQGTGHVFEYNGERQVINEWDNFDDWRKDIVGK